MALPWGAFVVPCDQGCRASGTGRASVLKRQGMMPGPLQEQRPAESHAAYRYYAARLARKAASGREPEATGVQGRELLT